MSFNCAEQETKQIFAQTGAIITKTHVVYAKKPDGWYHGDAYVNKDAVYPYTEHIKTLCGFIADYFYEMLPEVVIGPTVGGVALAQWTTDCLNQSTLPEVLMAYADEEDVFINREKILIRGKNYSLLANSEVVIECDEFGRHDAIYLEKIGTRRVIKRGFDKLVAGKRCLIVEDVVNSGATVAKTRDAVIAVGGNIIGVGCLCNRSGGKVTAETLSVPEFHSLTDLDMKMYPEDDCPLCKAGIPVRTDLGKGKEFLIRKGMI